jgi:multiple antibiotic resistance protein
MIEFIEAFILLLVIMDPLISIPTFLSVSKGKPKREQRNIALKAVLVAALVFVVFALGGDLVLNVLGVDLNSFMIAGGLILVILGVQLSLGLSFRRKNDDVSESSVVIGTPLISGPATITTTIILVKSMGILVPVVAGAIALIIVLVSMLFALRINNVMGKAGLRTLSTMMGLITIAWGVQFMLRGILAFS